MNRLNNEDGERVVALVETASINSTLRMTGISKPTILKLLNDLGTACHKYHDSQVRNLPYKRLQCDEIWCFCLDIDKNKTPRRGVRLQFRLDLDRPLS